MESKLSDTDKVWLKEAMREGIHEAFGIEEEEKPGTLLRTHWQYLMRMKTGSEDTKKWIRRGSIGIFLSWVAFIVIEGIITAFKMFTE